MQLSRAGIRRVPQVDGTWSSTTHFSSSRVSLGVVVSALMTLQWEPNALVRLLVPEVEVVEDGDEPLYCLNHTCPRYHVTSGGNIHLDGRRKGVQESYCDVCGSRFLGKRICLSFDLDCGPLGFAPVPHAIRRAQARLANWQHQLRLVCGELLRTHTPITVERAFAGAAIPRTRNLRALQLGLLSIVQEYVALQKELLSGSENSDRWAFQQKMHRRKRRAVG